MQTKDFRFGRCAIVYCSSLTQSQIQFGAEHRITFCGVIKSNGCRWSDLHLHWLWKKKKHFVFESAMDNVNEYQATQSVLAHTILIPFLLLFDILRISLSHLHFCNHSNSSKAIGSVRRTAITQHAKYQEHFITVLDCSPSYSAPWATTFFRLSVFTICQEQTTCFQHLFAVQLCDWCVRARDTKFLSFSYKWIFLPVAYQIFVNYFYHINSKVSTIFLANIFQ